MAEVGVRLLPALGRVELSYLIEGAKHEPGRTDFECPLDHADVEALRTFGKGRHSTGLNIGERFPDALARLANQPLMSRMDDFSRRDVVAGLQNT